MREFPESGYHEQHVRLSTDKDSVLSHQAGLSPLGIPASRTCARQCCRWWMTHTFCRPHDESTGWMVSIAAPHSLSNIWIPIQLPRNYQLLVWTYCPIPPPYTVRSTWEELRNECLYSLLCFVHPPLPICQCTPGKCLLYPLSSPPFISTLPSQMQVQLANRASSAIGNWEELESSLNAHPDVATFTELSSIARRADQLQVALPDGWSASVQQFSCFLPIPPSNFEEVEEFWTSIMVYALTQMIQNNMPQDRVAFRYGLWSLKFLMSPRSSVQEFQWSFVYYFAQFMLRWPQRGFVGYGGLCFRHLSGVMFTV